jgi:hypothetical protein
MVKEGHDRDLFRPWIDIFLNSEFRILSGFVVDPTNVLGIGGGAF